MFIRQKMGAKNIKYFAVFIISLVIAGCVLAVFRTMPSKADSEVIDISTDLVLGNSGTNWSYNADPEYDYNDLTITGDVTLTGTGVSGAKPLRIVGKHTITFDNFHFTTNTSPGLYVDNGYEINLVGDNYIISNRSSNYGVSAFTTGCTGNTASIIGSGSLNINMTNSNHIMSNGFFTSCSTTVDIGGSINISISDNTYSKGASRGFYMGSTLIMKNGDININVGSSDNVSQGIDAKYIKFDGGGSISSTISDKGNAHSSAIYSSAGYDVTSTSGRYKWTASENTNGSPLTSDYFPNNAFNVKSEYKHATLEHMPENTAPTVAITSPDPSGDNYTNDITKSVLTGTISDADGDTLTVEIGISDSDIDQITDWISCETSTTSQSFSCTPDSRLTPSADKRWNLWVKVTDEPANSVGYLTVYDSTKIIYDTTNPTAPTITYTNPYDESWTTSNVTAMITNGTDANVDKSTYTVRADGIDGPELTYDNPITISSEEITHIFAYTYDKAGNKSPQKLATVKIDRTAPTISSKVIDGDFLSGITYTSPPEIELNTSDGLSGVEEIHYSWHDGFIPIGDCTFDTVANYASIETTAPSDLGIHTLCYRAVDAAGNVSAEYNESYIITDLTAELTDDATGIEVENLGIGFTSDQYLKVSQLENNSFDAPEGKGVLAGFSIEICSSFDGECNPISEWPEKLRIKIPIDKYLETYENFSLIHIKNSGEIEDHQFTLSGEYLVFETGSLSDWIILGMQIPTKTDGDTSGSAAGLSAPNAGNYGSNSIYIAISLLLAAISSTILATINIKSIKK